MYSSSYSRAKFGLEAREPLHKPKGKSCGYYMRIIFFFSSLIQSLIIVSLVLFLIYGQPEKSAEEKRVEELEQSFNRLSANNIQLRKEKGELGAQLAARTAEKEAVEKEFAKEKNEFNNTEHALKLKQSNCERTVRLMSMRTTTPIQPPIMATTNSEMKILQSLNAQQQAMISLIQANFTQTVNYLSQERDSAVKDRDTHHQDAITLRRENDMLKEQHSTYTRKCKEDFSNSLDGIKTVTRDFLNKINNLFPHQLTFHLTCERQQDEMEKIRNNCSNLSKDVENKFQLYLDRVGNKVADIQDLSSRLEVHNIHLNSDLQKCERSRKEAAAQATTELQLKQRTHDDQVEKLLIAQNRLREQKNLQEESLALKDKEIQNLQRMLSAQSSFKPSASRPAGAQAAAQQRPSIGAPGINKTPTVKP
ncbi:Plasmalemma vesicle-associated protein [Collichthys lucidus]|uniref:Plasmalemma vesicle-associated protein n=1 Tax=Collichthys lucidus TaxID=240159 RepID=A0A4U5UI17_COLLU|nr:Plasmalemma vesicle-associated protein [Collichthys lucidus]